MFLWWSMFSDDFFLLLWCFWPNNIDLLNKSKKENKRRIEWLWNWVGFSVSGPWKVWKIDMSGLKLVQDFNKAVWYPTTPRIKLKHLEWMNGLISVTQLPLSTFCYWLLFTYLKEQKAPQFPVAPCDSFKEFCRVSANQINTRIVKILTRHFVCVINI